MKNLYTIACILVVLFSITTARGQFTDNFDDGNFTDPLWEGNTSSFIVNGSLQLQLQGDCAAGGENYLSTAVATHDSAVWEFFVNLDFSPSSSNYSRVYLQSTNADLMGSLNGYFLKIGEDGTDDVVRLFRQDGLTLTDICDGTTNISSGVLLGIKVVRTVAGEWQLYIDPTGGTTYALENSVTDITYDGGNYMGVYCKYTSTRCDLFYFDNFFVDPLYVDTDAPFITGVSVISASQLEVHFNENLEIVSAETESNYSVDGGIGNPVSAVQNIADHTIVTLDFAASFPEATTLTLSVGNVADESGNAIAFDDAAFTYYTTHPYDVLISELLPDIDPQIALPFAEYVELLNTTDVAIDISGYYLADLTDQTVPFNNYNLPAGGYVIVCDDADVALFAAYPNVLGVAGFPTLNNDGDNIQLFAPGDILMHAVNFTTDWYDNAIKADGGWSLELIDPQNPCQGDENWTASEDESGGTPGTVNSVNASNPDETAPMLLNAYPSAPDTVYLYFDEPVEFNAITVADISIDNGIGTPASLVINAETPDKIGITLSTVLSTGIVYTVTVTNISDCSGNIIGTFNTAKFGLPEPAAAGDVVINEILFNPVSSGVDFVEIYNNSEKLIDLSKLTIAEMDLTDTAFVKEFGVVSGDGKLLFPGNYMCVTSDIENVTSQYFTSDSGNFIASADLPNFDDDEGIVVLYDQMLNEIDRLHFNSDWHYALLSDEDGVSLERVNYTYPTQDANNWHSAAEDVHFGTPGYQNSVFGATGTTGDIQFDYTVFSPDGDGYHDLLVINYSTPADGYTAIFKIFNAQGKPVKELTNAITLSRTGFITWDGVDDDDKPAGTGIYILYTEMYNTAGAVEKHKDKFTLVRKQ